VKSEGSGHINVWPDYTPSFLEHFPVVRHPEGWGCGMDPVTVGAVLLAILSGVAGEAGSKLWDGVVALVRRPFRHPEAAGALTASQESGVAQLQALAQAPTDQEGAVALAEALLARADADAGFRRELEDWWSRTTILRTGEGNVTNVISGGTQHGPVLQGRDFTDLMFGFSPPTSSD
jgi:hypothetical protein